MNLLGSAQDESLSFGANNLRKKIDTIDDAKEKEVGLDKAQELVTEIFDETVKAAIVGIEFAKKAFTPGFITRYQNKKIHEQKIAVIEVDVDHVREKNAETIEEEYKKHLVDQRRFNRLKTKLDKESHLRKEVQDALQEAKASVAKAEVEDYKQRRALQLAEVQAAIDKEKQEALAKAEKTAHELRTWRTEHWGKQAREWHDEAVQNKEGKLANIKKEYVASVNRTYDEWADRDFSRARLQVERPPLQDPVGLPGHELGVYGTTIESGEAEHVEGIDDYELHLFSPSPQMEYETYSIGVADTEMQVAKVQALYDALHEDTKVLGRVEDQIKNMKEVEERDLRQVEHEIALADRAPLGPPRRLPVPAEMAATNLRKDRVANHKRRIDELVYGMNVTNGKKKAAETQLLSLAKQLAVLRQKDGAALGLLQDFNGGFGDLPIVIGRNISKVPGIGEFGKPLEMMNGVIQKSKLTGLRAMKDEAIKVHKELNAMDQQMWLSKQEDGDTKGESDRALNLLAEVGEKLQKAHVENMKLSLVESLKAFIASKTPLNKATLREMGPLPWFRYRNTKLSSNIISYESGEMMGVLSFEPPDPHAQKNEVLAYGVTLGEACSGYCTGIINLPKEGIWSVLVPIARQLNSELEAFPEFDTSDFVTVRIGPTLGSMTVIGQYFNKENPDTGAVLYDVRHVVKGSSIAFRFDFSSSHNCAVKHLAIGTGLFEEYTMKELERRPDPKVPSRERVLSSYVQEIRIEEKQGKMRETKLLEELVAVDEAKTKYFDSEIVNSIPQRYNREYFKRILRAEVLLQQRQQLTAVKLEAESAEGLGSTAVAGLETDTVAKLNWSAKRFEARKHATQQAIVDKGMDLVSKRLEVLDNVQNRWRHVFVKECIIEWVDNGTKARITHLVQEYDDHYDPVGPDFIMDISVLRYFVAAVQVVDRVAIQRIKEAKEWEHRLQTIEDDAHARVQDLRIAFEKFKLRELTAYRKDKRRKFKKFEDTASTQAQMILQSKAGQEKLRQYMSSVLLDMRKGIVPVDETVKPRVQAKTVAGQRFMSEWIEQKRNELFEQYNELERVMTQRLSGRQRELDEFEGRILEESAVERHNLKWQLSEQKRDSFNALKARLKFDPQEFQKALPKADNCMHAKTKAWGDSYGMGVKCCLCGKELSELYLEESQALGYGTGTDQAMYDAIKRHRQNEASFNFKSPQELERVEQERVRLEKERREMELDEAYFYDFQDLKAIYKFDHRHARAIKDAGIFRQGLQWTEEELELFEIRQVLEEKQRRRDAGLVEGEAVSFDPLSMIQEPPPTFRAVDERRHAQYQELIYSMGRIYNFQRRIGKLKEERLEQMSERAIFSFVLVALHKESYVLDSDIQNLEDDLVKTSKLLKTYDKMRKLWQNANKIMTKAVRDRKKAEMNRCGVWEAVREATDAASFLHDETRELIKAKYLLDAQLEEKEKLLVFRKTSLETWREKWEEADQEARGMQYRRPGEPVMTAFGYCYIRVYRKKDDMLMVTLPWGEPPAKAWLHAPAVVAVERGRQHGERLLMDMEDQAMHEYNRIERTRSRKERQLMEKEEAGLRRFYEFEDLGKHEKGAIETAIDAAVRESYLVTETKKYYAAMHSSYEKTLDTIVTDIETESKDYKGPASGKPKPLSRWQIHRKWKDIITEFRHAFVMKAALKAEAGVKAALNAERFDWIQNDTFYSLIDLTLDEMTMEVAQECIKEGKAAKIASERISGLLFPTPVWMQYTTYESLSTVWKLRKQELKERIDANKGLAAKTAAANTKRVMDPQQIAALKEQRRKRRQERRRQAAMNAEMAREDALSHSFYHWELLENLRERRMMREEDQVAQKLRKEEADLKKAAQSAYAVSAGAAQDQQAAIKVSSTDRRRDELKEITLERRRRQEERAHMIIEDKLSEALREVDRLERQRQQFIAEFGVDEDDDEAEAGEEKQEEKLVVKVPDWMKKPDGWDDWDVKRQMKYLQFQTEMRIRYKVVEKKHRIERKRLEKMEKKSTKEWAATFSVFDQKAMDAEMEAIQFEEETKETEADVMDLKENMSKILVFCREKGEEELKARSELRKREEYARRRDRELKEAEDWVELCIRRAKTRDKIKRKVTESCLWIDTDSITGFHQRFRTELLRVRLYEDFFTKIVFWISNLAEIIATERRLMNLQERLSFNREALDDRILNMQKVWRSLQRKDLLRMRRSKLNERFFPKQRRATLYERFSSWVRYYYWNRGHQDAFKLKYEIIKRQLDIDRQFKAQLLSHDEPFGAKKTASDSIPTFMQRHRSRPAQCRFCLTFYLEAQNHSIVCHYHPSPYGLFCPKSCTNPGLSGLCSSHKLRRWRCCDQTKPNATGCSRRAHVPPDSDPVYDKILSLVVERDQASLGKIDEKLGQARKEDWPSKYFNLQQGLVFKTEDQIAKDRLIVEHAKHIKWV